MEELRRLLLEHQQLIRELGELLAQVAEDLARIESELGTSPSSRPEPSGDDLKDESGSV